jgi:hypothetical protein
MKSAALGLSLAIAAMQAVATIWTPPVDRGGWFASNQIGFYSSKRVVPTDEVKLEFLFVSGLVNSDTPKSTTFQVVASPATLSWPMRITVESDPTQPPFVLGGDPAAPIRLEGVEAHRLLGFLKDGHGLDVIYMLADGVELHVYLDAFKFPQAVAMFEACKAHVA